MKKTVLALLISGLALLALGAETPKIAVLDCAIPKGFDNTVIIPITENIMEEMVNSGKFKVLDRANISAIFKEKEFQLTGEVTDKDIAQAGQLLGANFVVVTKMQQVGDTYFLTSKMIDITTGEIGAQASYSQEGKLTVLLSMAHTVGWSLATGQKIVQSNPTAAAVTVPRTAGPAVAGGAGPAMAVNPGPNLVQRARSSPPSLRLAKGMTLYTQVGLHPEAKRHGLSAVNVQFEGEYLPPGTQVQVVAFDRNTLKFHLPGNKDVYDYEDHKQGNEPFLVHLARDFGESWDPALLNGLSRVDLDGISSGRILPGMSRDGVILAAGYPPRLENRDIGAPRWVYWVTPRNKNAVTFDNNGLVVSFR
jgi:TolB-like protein